MEKDAQAGQYVIVRSVNAGVFAGFLAAPVTGLGDGTPLSSVTLTDARRIWYWDGASSLSQLAEEGVSKPGNCKFPVAVGMVVLMEVCEVLAVTAAAQASIAAVPVWES